MKLVMDHSFEGTLVFYGQLFNVTTEAIKHDMKDGELTITLVLKGRQVQEPLETLLDIPL